MSRLRTRLPRPWCAAIAATVLFGGFLSASPATAGTAPTTATPASATASASGSSDADAEAADQKAAETGTPTWSASFSIAVDAVRQQFPDSFGAAQVNPDQRSGWVAFAGAVPAGAAGLLGDIDGVELRADLGATETQLTDAASALFDELNAAAGGTASFTTYPDAAAKHIVVEYGPVSEDTALLRSAGAVATGAIDDVVQAATVPTGFSVEVVDTGVPVTVETEVFHGARVLAGVCTGAFPVKRKGGTELGILTAAHCPGTGSYDGTADAFYSPYPYSISTETGSGGGDFRWNHSKYGLSGLTFVGDGMPLRTFTTHATPTVGSQVCGYGRMTDYKCQTVEACNLTSSSPVPDTGQSYPVGGLCRTVDQVTRGGDSGGPWFDGTTAYGIHHGSNSLGSYFSLVNNALEKTRVNLVVDASGNTVP